MSDPPPLPDTSRWLPRSDAKSTLQAAFLHRCQVIEERIQLRARHEQARNIDNFDSGPGVEDIVREEISNLLPARYSTTAGVLCDSHGQTGGDYDLVVFNSDWVPNTKAGAATTSRRVHLPIEGVYAVGEVKQTLDYRTLDDAMEKLVIAHRLYRPPTSANRIVENRELDSCQHGLTNPLFSFIIATRLREGVELDQIVRRFVEINQELRRLHVVRCLCILGVDTLHWVFTHDEGDLRPALFMGEDLFEDLTIAIESSGDTQSAFYAFIRLLLLHLYHSVLAPEDIASKYGPAESTIMIPSPDDELIHSACSRPTRSPSVPWDMEWDPFGTTRVDATLGAHVDLKDDELDGT